MSPEEKKQMTETLAADKLERQKVCGEGIEALLKLHNCRLEGQVTINNKGIRTDTIIVPLD